MCRMHMLIHGENEGVWFCSVGAWQLEQQQLPGKLTAGLILMGSVFLGTILIRTSISIVSTASYEVLNNSRPVRLCYIPIRARFTLPDTAQQLAFCPQEDESRGLYNPFSPGSSRKGPQEKYQANELGSNQTNENSDIMDMQHRIEAERKYIIQAKRQAILDTFSNERLSKLLDAHTSRERYNASSATNSTLLRLDSKKGRRMVESVIKSHLVLSRREI